METFEKSICIKCTAEELFDFHLDVNNIEKITPQNIKVKLLTSNFVPKVGACVEIRSTKNFIPFNWLVEIDKLQRPNILIDIAIKSPFKYWKHEHIIIKHKNFTELKDVVTYELPFGFLGKLLRNFIHNDLLNMFRYRHISTKKILEERSV